MRKLRRKAWPMWRESPLDLKHVPAEPGVYRMLDEKRKVLYVGKARNLKKRIASYFQRRPESPRTEAMVQKVCDVSFTVTVSEAEALIVEHNLIKQLKPRYNVLLKDAKSYPYILLTDEDYPRLKLYRGNRDESGEYFGPFPNAGAVHATLHIMQKIFRIRDCENTVFAHRSRPCMQYQIGRCSAPCCGSVSREEYTAQVEEVRDFLKGRDRQLLKAWEKDMQAAADNLDYEQAALLRDRIRALRTILAGADSSALPADADAMAIVRHAGGVVASIGVRRSGRDLGTHTVQVAQAWDADDLEILQSLLTERYRKDTAPDYIFLDITDGYINKLKDIMNLVRPGTRTQIL
ncbi:MAG: excinuclease ABC subunit UvrC, partial [Mariprofundaceae bacterium]|nr:excinuclease ABC subunit UvrC [Mariprofundaceae bacterium]